MQTIVIVSGPTLLRDYLHYKSLGYRTLWSGEGKIALEPPKKGTNYG